MKPAWGGASNVQPRRRVLPQPSTWECECWEPETVAACCGQFGRGGECCGNPVPELEQVARRNRGYLARCPDCGTRRPGILS